MSIDHGRINIRRQLFKQNTMKIGEILLVILVTVALTNAAHGQTSEPIRTKTSAQPQTQSSQTQIAISSEQNFQTAPKSNEQAITKDSGLYGDRPNMVDYTIGQSFNDVRMLALSVLETSIIEFKAKGINTLTLEQERDEVQCLEENEETYFFLRKLVNGMLNQN